MKQIEGQILLSINQYFPTDFIRMAKKSQGMMNLFVENISEKVRKGIIDCDLDSSTLEINNQDQPLFTLTAEEIMEVKCAIVNRIHDLKIMSKYSSTPEVFLLEGIQICENLFKRLNDYKNGH